MSHNEKIACNGVIKNIFAHRFTFDVEGKIHLADLGPKGVDAFPLTEGLAVRLEGERRPSEIKVTQIAIAGQAPVFIHHKKPHHKAGDTRPDGSKDPSAAIAAVNRAGWAPAGEPREKPKHFEVLARREGGAWTELHVDLAGTIYKEKIADPHKWAILA